MLGAGAVASPRARRALARRPPPQSSLRLVTLVAVTIGRAGGEPCGAAGDSNRTVCESWGCTMTAAGACVKPRDWLATPVIGVGWKKTGTTSLEQAFRLLHLTPVCRCALPRLSRHKASADSGGYMGLVGRVRQLKDMKFAAGGRRGVAKFVLTTRAAATWNASIVYWTTVVKTNKFRNYAQLMARPDDGGAAPPGAGNGSRVDPVDAIPPGSRRFVEAYERYNSRICDLFRDSGDRLLELDLERDDPVDAMRRFCAFVDPKLLGRPECHEPFPHANVATTVRKRGSAADDRRPPRDPTLAPSRKPTLAPTPDRAEAARRAEEKCRKRCEKKGERRKACKRDCRAFEPPADPDVSEAAGDDAQTNALERENQALKDQVARLKGEVASLNRLMPPPVPRDDAASEFLPAPS